MNPIVKSLIEESNLSDFLAPNQKHRAKDLEKFTELIIKECVATMRKTLEIECDNESEKFGCKCAIIDVKEHFNLVEDGDVVIKLV